MTSCSSTRCPPSHGMPACPALIQRQWRCCSNYCAIRQVRGVVAPVKPILHLATPSDTHQRSSGAAAPLFHWQRCGACERPGDAAGSGQFSRGSWPLSSSSRDSVLSKLLKIYPPFLISIFGVHRELCRWFRHGGNRLGSASRRSLTARRCDGRCARQHNAVQST